MKILILSISILILRMGCAYRPTVKIEATMPSDVLSNAVREALHPTWPDTVYVDTCFIP